MYSVQGGIRAFPRRLAASHIGRDHALLDNAMRDEALPGRNGCDSALVIQFEDDFTQIELQCAAFAAARQERGMDTGQGVQTANRGRIGWRRVTIAGLPGQNFGSFIVGESPAERMTASWNRDCLTSPCCETVISQHRQSRSR